MDGEGGGELGEGKHALADGAPRAADAGGGGEGHGRQPRQHVLEKIFADQIDVAGAAASALSLRLRRPVSSGRILASRHDRGGE